MIMKIGKEPNTEPNSELHPDIDTDLDFALAQPLLSAPSDFEQRVLIGLVPAEFAVAPPTAAVRSTTTSGEFAHRAASKLMSDYLLKPLRALALLGSAALALSEVFAFVFGLWTVSTAL
jgi:hypothetical protein